jgi:arabinogalactan oligomer / maltooligosaccharide transport system permease protein
MEPRQRTLVPSTRSPQLEAPGVPFLSSSPAPRARGKQGLSTRLLQAGVCVATLLGALPAAAQSPPLRVWHAYREGGDEQRALAESLSRYRTTLRASGQDAEIEVLAIPFEGYASKLAAAIPSGNGPDVFLDAHERLGDFRARGLVSPVGDALGADDAAGYAPSALQAVTLGGVVLAVPLSRKCLALFLNNQLVPKDPVYLEEVLDQEGLPEGVFPLAHVATSAYSHAPFLASFGGKLLGPDDTFGFDSEAGVRSVAFVRQLLDSGKIPQEAGGSLVADLFGSGKAAAAVGGPWLTGDLGQAPPYRVVPLPKLRATDEPLRPLLTVEAAMLTPSGAKNPSVRALARYLGGDEAADVRANVGHMVSARREPPPSANADPLLSAFSLAADNADPMPTRNAMRLVFEPADRALRKVMRGDALPKAALEEAAHRFADVRRPLPPPTSRSPYAILLGLLALLGAGLMFRESRSPTFGERLRRSLPAYAYVSLSALAVLALVVFPLAVGTLSSFYAGRGEDMRFVGLAHYASILTARGAPLLSTGSFYLVLLVTLLWTVANLALHVGIGAALGLALSRTNLRGRAMYRVLLIIPWAVPSYVTALAWKGMFHRQFGAINAILSALGAEPVSWFAKFSTSFAANLATNVWLGFPFFMVVTLGALTSVPPDVLEAAEVDGATRWQRLRLVTLPMIRPALAPAIALGAVWTFNMFNVVFLVSSGDPDGTTDILVSEAYRWAFTREAQVGYAAAYAVLIFLLLAGGTRGLARLTERAA